MLKPKYLRRLTLVIIALLTFLTISWYSTQAYSASPTQRRSVPVIPKSLTITNPQKASFSKINHRTKDMTDIEEKFTIKQIKKGKTTEWINADVGMRIATGGFASVMFWGKKNQVINVGTAPEYKFSLFSWPCQGEEIIMGMDYKKEGNKTITDCSVLGKGERTKGTSLRNTNNGEYASNQKNYQLPIGTKSFSIKSLLKSDANTPEANQASVNTPFFCSAADINNGQWDFAISDNEPFIDIFSKNRACYRALAECKKRGGDCSITNFGRWEEQRPAVALFDCAAEARTGSTGREKNQKNKIYPDGNIKEDGEDGLKTFASQKVVNTIQDKKRLDYCVLRIFNKGQISVTEPTYYVEKDVDNKDNKTAFSKDGTEQSIILASVSSKEDDKEAIKLITEKFGYKDFYSSQGNNNETELLKYGTNGTEEKIIAFVVKGTAEFQLLSKDAKSNSWVFEAPTFNQGEGIILNVETGVTKTIESFRKCDPSLLQCDPILKPTKTLRGNGFRIQVPVGWKIVDNAKADKDTRQGDYVTVSEALNTVRQKDSQLANAYIDASFTKFQNEVKEKEFAQSLRQQIESYIDSPDKFIVTDFEAALGIGQVSLKNPDFQAFVRNFRKQAEDNTTRFLENQPEYTQELTWSGRDAIKLRFDLNLDTPNGELKEMSYLVYLIKGLRDSDKYYVVNLTVPKNLAESYGETFKGIIDSFQPVSETNTQPQSSQKSILPPGPFHN